jgi:hypothetical protein
VPVALKVAEFSRRVDGHRGAIGSCEDCHVPRLAQPLDLGGVSAHRLIHPTAQKACSRNFAMTAFYEIPFPDSRWFVFITASTRLSSRRAGTIAPRE